MKYLFQIVRLGVAASSAQLGWPETGQHRLTFLEEVLDDFRLILRHRVVLARNEAAFGQIHRREPRDDEEVAAADRLPKLRGRVGHAAALVSLLVLQQFVVLRLHFRQTGFEFNQFPVPQVKLLLERIGQRGTIGFAFHRTIERPAEAAVEFGQAQRFDLLVHFGHHLHRHLAVLHQQ